MKTGNMDPPQHDREQSSERVIHPLTFREIYDAINHGDDFNEPQLFYLSRLVRRKLNSFDPRFRPGDLEVKPYQTKR